jgi:hypothetical protein
MHCSFAERYLRKKGFGQIVLLKESIAEEGRTLNEEKLLILYFKTAIIYVIAFVKFVRSHKLQDYKMGFTLCTLMHEDNGGRPKHVARRVRIINLLCLTAINY